jgi:pimeloyl-ACP methyl ester carboxylesterase
MILRATALAAAFALGLVTSVFAAPGLMLRPCHVAGVQEELRCGTYEVFENRQTERGRKLPLKIVVLKARESNANAGPLFFLSGGPGETNTDFVAHFQAHALRRTHDIVFVDFRGTGEGHRLACNLRRSDDHLEGYLQTPFSPDLARACRDELMGRFDLSQYSTAASVDDLDDVRRALGYDKINLLGGSFGSYAGLMYIRAYGAHVRSAYLASPVTLQNTVPLYHAQAAQEALDQLFAQCAADALCRGAYPALEQDFASVVARLRQGPVRTSVSHPVTGAKVEIALSEKAFADAVRVIMYSGESGREIPFLIRLAKNGNFEPFAARAVNASRGFYAAIPLGLYYAITCNEFVSRIREQDIEAATRGSYAGSWRVRDQMASCRAWPKTNLPATYFAPFRSDVPALLISGDTDPVAPRRWGEIVHAFMPNSVHVVVPGGHTPDSDCTYSIAEAMMQAGSTNALSLDCVAGLRPAPFKLP